MIEEIQNPLRDYRDTYHQKFLEAAEKEFQQFADTANVDVEANRQTCASVAHFQDLVRKMGKKLTWLWVLFTVLILMAVAAWCLWFAEVVDLLLPILVTVGVVVLELVLVYPRIKKLKRKKKECQGELDKYIEEAYRQMEPLNSLYDDEIMHRLVAQVIPIVSLDTYLHASDMDMFTDEFGWQNTPGSDRAAVGVQSGKIRGNPFMICRRMVHTMGQKTYTGSITVAVTKTRTINGKTERYMSSEVLTASVTAPFPEYNHETELVYGNQAAPELVFTRKKNFFKNKKGSLSFKYTEHKLKRKAAKLDKDFAMMTNEEFEVLFTTADRNNNLQYSLLFTPVAQENLIDLIRDEESTGYGDDFDFYKNGRINTIISEHMQNYALDWSPKRLRNYEYDKAKELFLTTYDEAFKGLYFALAPLLCIPLYQQMHPDYDVRMHRPLGNGCHTLQQEVLAYYWGEDKFRHPDCATNCILKTDARQLADGSSEVEVTSYGYRRIPRVSYITKYDSNGHSHQVPVHWDEYLPVEGSGKYNMKETDGYSEDANTPQKRLSSARERLSQLPGAMLYRHIATWM